MANPNPKPPPEGQRFKPGQSGNPNGSSKRQRLTSALIRHIEEKGLDDKLALVALKAALEGDFKFWQIVAHMVDGKPQDAEPETEATTADDEDEGIKIPARDPRYKARKGRRQAPKGD